MSSRKRNKKRTDFEHDGRPLTNSPFSQLTRTNAAVSMEPADEPASLKSAESMHAFSVGKTRKGSLPIFVEHRPGGKTVTVIRNVSGDARALLDVLKKRCGAGGVLREGDVEIQGDHRERVETYLRENS